MIINDYFLDTANLSLNLLRRFSNISMLSGSQIGTGGMKSTIVYDDCVRKQGLEADWK
jgi:glutamate 5-kinase